MRTVIVAASMLLAVMAVPFSEAAQASANVLPLAVHLDSAVTTNNIPTVSVTLCVPGYTDSAHCQTIPDMLVDTGASGLRVVASVLTPALQQALVPETANGGNVAECLQYVESAVWGSVSQADVWLGTDPTTGTPAAGAEYAKSVPIHIMGSSNVPSAPSSCSSTGPVQDTVAAFGSNGTIGVSPAVLDGEPLYYTCSATSCTQATLPSSAQIPNPVGRLPVDNNGVVLQVNALSSGNAQASGSGSLILGIGTETNNQLASTTKIDYVNSGYGMNDIKFQVGSNSSKTLNSNYYDAFDSGTNWLVFPSLSGLSSVSSSSGLFTPSSPTQVAMTVTDANGTVTSGYSFTVAKYSNTTLNSDAALSQIGGEDSIVLIGFPYFYGKTLYFAMDGAQVTGANGSKLTGPFNGL